ncbi:Fic family protein [Thiomonas sp. FB-Cd]|uniref:Fic family protein n=1 Tax=Thiomonas sp. FB-Cd TaxID=1158292 RepID=UPI0004DFC037|nr:Fic family protein [Thiomonas sp. FB-Cd]
MHSTPTQVVVYDHPAQFEPLMPGNAAAMQELALRIRGVVEASLRLQGSAHPVTRQRLRELVRAMNSYYSNCIEGQSTHPRYIESALRKDFSDKPDVAQRQRIALAHIEAERELEGLGAPEEAVLQSPMLLRAHAALYGRLTPQDRTTEDGHVVQPGQLRQEDVIVHRHHPPTWTSLPGFLSRMDGFYGRRWSLDMGLVAVACLHHRVAWVHAFRDGNGRAARLQTHVALQPLSAGLWSVNRGLARQRDAYYTHLSNADMARQGDLDGRGNLSERMLLEWCRFFIGVCEDQVQFMTEMLDLGALKKRLHALVLVKSQTEDTSAYRSELVVPLHYVLAAGPLSRREFVQMTGLGERTARHSLSRLLADGLLRSDSPKGDVSLGFPLDQLHLLFPNLYPEAAAKPVDA